MTQQDAGSGAGAQLLWPCRGSPCPTHEPEACAPRLCSSAPTGSWEGHGQPPAAAYQAAEGPCEQVPWEWVSAPETLLLVLLILLDLTQHSPGIDQHLHLAP